MNSQDTIRIRKARNHNLKNVSVDIPKNKLVVFTGVSGSGKSTLAFDTIYAEGQRRYVESLSSYARQFLGIMPKPEVDSIDGLSPAISIDQKTTTHNPRSTVGTITEIYDYLRLLFARIGHPHCTNCGREVVRMDKDQITTSIVELLLSDIKSALGTAPKRHLILSPVVRDRKGEYSGLLKNLLGKGYNTARIDSEFIDLAKDIFLIKTNKHSIDVVIDQISVDKNTLKSEENKNRLLTSVSHAVEQSLNLSEGLVILCSIHDASFTFPKFPKKVTDQLFSQHLSCPYCNISFSEIEPRLFSFNSPHGACPLCKGLGNELHVDKSRVLNENLSISEGGILPFSNQFNNDTWYSRVILTVAKENDIDSKIPFLKMGKDKKELLLHGTGSKTYRVFGTNRFGIETSIVETYQGIIAQLENKYKESASEFVQKEIEKYMHKKICSLCKGSRLSKESLSVTIQNQSITDICNLSIDKALEFFTALVKIDTVSKRETLIAEPILKEIIKRLAFLESVGLNYLTLSRDATTLAGGESQRIRLASQIGSGLSGVLYVLDEPSIGLHPRDNSKLIRTLLSLRDLGNSVLVVEHDREMIASADYILDFGPGGGNLGGNLVAKGSLSDILKTKESLTGLYLSGKKKVIFPRQKRLGNYQEILIFGAKAHNLKSLDISFPLHTLIGVTGVSGSGKSTLIVDTLYKALKQKLTPNYKEEAGVIDDIKGFEKIKYVHLIDQSPIGRTPRSNPITYVGAFSYIRQLFASTKEARSKGFGPGRFSFNVKGGRCEVCEGQGQERIEMQFLPPVWVECDACKGKRYNLSTLEVEFNHKTISDILHMTIDESCEFFKFFAPLYQKLITLKQVGLGYLQLGQSAPTLSGGEAQRVKLASELSKRSSQNNVYILDEPTTGLHFADLEKLLDVLKSLVNSGNTVIVIEHNLDIIRNCDYIIDLGPQGGDLGGYVVAKGTPEEIKSNPKSYTGKYL